MSGDRAIFVYWPVFRRRRQAISIWQVTASATVLRRRATAPLERTVGSGSRAPGPTAGWSRSGAPEVGTLGGALFEGMCDAFRRRVDADTLAFAKYLLEEHGVVLAPESGFGTAGEGRLRFSFVNSMDLETDFDRLEAGIAAYRAEG